MQGCRFVKNECCGAVPREFCRSDALAVRAFHQGVPGYAETRLAELRAYAEEQSVKAVLVKDESGRFGLKAFKGLGGSYAMFRILCDRLGLDPVQTSFSDLTKEECRDAIREVTFVTTTDGNHGKGVSWAAGLFGCDAHVFMPKGTVEARAKAVRAAGSADVVITDLTYDECVQYTSRLAEERGWCLIQDTSWDGYEDVPRLIMQGYETLCLEMLEQLEAMHLSPTHVFLQAGVGALAGTVIGMLADAYPDALPVISIVEPDAAACVYESIAGGDGSPRTATGSGRTMMAGLNCGTPCTIAWDLIRAGARFAFSCEDTVAARGMRLLARPRGADPAIVAGESGAAPMGLLDLVLADPAARAALGITEDSVLLCINTEGDTDPENYQKVLAES